MLAFSNSFVCVHAGEHMPASTQGLYLHGNIKQSIIYHANIIQNFKFGW